MGNFGERSSGFFGGSTSGGGGGGNAVIILGEGASSSLRCGVSNHSYGTHSASLGGSGIRFRVIIHQ